MRKRCTETKQQLLFSTSFNALKWQADTTNGMGTLLYKLVLHSDLGPHPRDTEDSKDPPQVRIFPVLELWATSHGPTDRRAGHKAGGQHSTQLNLCLHPTFS